METIKRMNRFYDTTRFGLPEIRVYHKKKASERKAPVTF
jgi:hypothetical protein